MNDLASTTTPSPALTARTREVLTRAEANGIPIRLLGYQVIFTGVRAYAGVEHDWVLASAADDPLVRRDELAIPKAELRVLRRLLDAGLDCPAVYIAHEIPKGRLALPSQAHGSPVSVGHPIAPAAGELLVDRVPVPPRTAAIARHAGNAAGALITLLAVARPLGSAVGKTVRAVAEAGADGAATAVRGLDPIVFGAWTAGARPEPGVPAAFFELVRFTY
jgi:hypothetical protein